MREFLKRLFHVHKWKYTDATHFNSQAELLAVELTPATRECLTCGKRQVRERHCLGLNPPDYVDTWTTQ